MLRKLFAKATSRWTSQRMLVPSKEKAGEAKIAVSKVEHSYGKRGSQVEALRDININIHPGEFVCLLGPSGCGKTTLLYALAGQFPPTDGHIAIDGKPVHGPGPERLLMFQEPALFPWMSVRQNLVFALKGKLRSKRLCEERAQHFIHQVHLDGFENALPHELSGGMKMRASLARALAMDPAVLLMDEPFAALDAQTRGHMHQLLQQIWQQSRKTVVFVTHDVREALVLSDRVVVMAARPGRILKDLEVRLARPRDPDDEVLVGLSRQIREDLRAAERAGAKSKVEEAVDGKAEDDAAAGGVPAGLAPPLGAGG